MCVCVCVCVFERGSNAKTIGTIIRDAVLAARDFVRSGNQNASQIAMNDE